MYPCVDKVRQFTGQRDDGLVVPNAYPCGLVWDFAYDPTFSREEKELFVTTERFTKRDQTGLALFEPFSNSPASMQKVLCTWYVLRKPLRRSLERCPRNTRALLRPAFTVGPALSLNELNPALVVGGMNESDCCEGSTSCHMASLALAALCIAVLRYSWLEATIIITRESMVKKCFYHQTYEVMNRSAK